MRDFILSLFILTYTCSLVVEVSAEQIFQGLPRDWVFLESEFNPTSDQCGGLSGKIWVNIRVKDVHSIAEEICLEQLHQVSPASAECLFCCKLDNYGFQLLDSEAAQFIDDSLRNSANYAPYPRRYAGNIYHFTCKAEHDQTLCNIWNGNFESPFCWEAWDRGYDSPGTPNPPPGLFDPF